MQYPPIQGTACHNHSETATRKSRSSHIKLGLQKDKRAEFNTDRHYSTCTKKPKAINKSRVIRLTLIKVA